MREYIIANFSVSHPYIPIYNYAYTDVGCDEASYAHVGQEEAPFELAVGTGRAGQCPGAPTGPAS